MAEIESFYNYKFSGNISDDNVLYQIEFNPLHDIFSGHFPDQPVVPGVLILKLIVDSTSDYLGSKLLLQKATQCKFLNFVDPRLNPVLFLQLHIYENEKGIDVKAVLKDETVIFTKASLTLQSPS